MSDMNQINLSLYFSLIAVSVCFLQFLTPSSEASRSRSSCADPENFVRGGPTLNFFFFIFFLEWREDPNQYHYKGAIIHPPAKRHLNGILLPGR